MHWASLAACLLIHWWGDCQVLAAPPLHSEPATETPSSTLLPVAGVAVLLAAMIGMGVERIFGRSRSDAEATSKPAEASTDTEKEKLLAERLQSVRRIAHDFNNLLTGVVGHLTLIREDPALPEPFAKRLQEVENSAFKARDLTRELLKLAREGGTVPISETPQQRTAPAPGGSHTQTPSPKAGPAQRILAMDDEPAICALLTALLEHYGYEVTTVVEGSAAVRAYARAMDEGRPFSAVIMDMNIPGGMGGTEAVKHLHKLDPKVKAIISSGSTGDPVMVNFLDHGFAARVEKPYRLQELAQVLQELLGPRPNKQPGT